MFFGFREMMKEIKMALECASYKGTKPKEKAGT